MKLWRRKAKDLDEVVLDDAGLRKAVKRNLRRNRWAIAYTLPIIGLNCWNVYAGASFLRSQPFGRVTAPVCAVLVVIQVIIVIRNLRAIREWKGWMIRFDAAEAAIAALPEDERLAVEAELDAHYKARQAQTRDILELERIARL